MLDAAAQDTIRKRLLDSRIRKPFSDEHVAVVSKYNLAVKPLFRDKLIIASQPSAIRVKTTVPLQRKLDATSRLLNMPELLEKLLLHLPPRDLLRAQGVCHTLHSTIRATPSIVATTAAVRDNKSRISMRTIHHIGSGDAVELESGFCHLGTLSAQEFRDIEASEVLRDMYVAQPPPRAFPVRHTCFNGGEGGAWCSSDSFTVTLTSGVKFDHVFAALHDLLWDGYYNGLDCQRSDCEDGSEDPDVDFHLIQVEVAWKYDCGILQAKAGEYLKPEYVRQRVLDVDDGSDIERWRKRVHYLDEYENSN